MEIAKRSFPVAVLSGLYTLEFVMQFFEKQRPDQPEDGIFGSVMRALLSACHLVDWGYRSSRFCDLCVGRRRCAWRWPQ